MGQGDRRGQHQVELTPQSPSDIHNVPFDESGSFSLSFRLK
jgi:hypothetical protein